MITRTWVWRAAAVAVMTLMSSPLLAQSIVADGGFDSQAASVSQFCYNSACPSGAWTVYGNAGFIRQGNIDWPAPTPVSPVTVAFLQMNTGGLQQAVTVPASGSYVVVYWLASRLAFSCCAGNQTVRVTLAGQVVAQKALSSGQAFRRYVSTPVNLSAGTPYTLLLSGLASGDNTAFVDNVSVTSATSTTSYSYDALGRLTGVSSTGGVNAGLSSNYAYDKAGNRTQVTVSGVN